MLKMHTGSWPRRLACLTLIGSAMCLAACGTRTQTVVLQPPAWMLEPCKAPEVDPELKQAKTLRQYSEAMTHRELDWQEALAICNGQFEALKYWYEEAGRQNDGK